MPDNVYGRPVKVRFAQKVLVKCEIDIEKYQKLFLDVYFLYVTQIVAIKC